MLYTVRSKSVVGTEGKRSSVERGPSNNSSIYNVRLQRKAQGYRSRNCGFHCPSSNFELIPVVADFTASQRKLGLPCYMDGNRTSTKHYFGRDEAIKAIEEALVPSIQNRLSKMMGLKTYSLCSLGGVGKTEIATNFMVANNKKFDAGLVFPSLALSASPPLGKHRLYKYASIFFFFWSNRRSLKVSKAVEALYMNLVLSKRPLNLKRQYYIPS